jgi:hypothetical protein
MSIKSQKTKFITKLNLNKSKIKKRMLYIISKSLLQTTNRTKKKLQNYFNLIIKT